MPTPAPAPSLDLGTYLFGYNGLPISVDIAIDTWSATYLAIALFVAMVLALLVFGFVFR